MSVSQILLTTLGFVLPLLLIARAFMLSRKAKGWYGLSVAGLLYTFGAGWSTTAVLALTAPSADQEARLRLTLTAGIPLFIALIFCAELLYWAPALAKKGWGRWKHRKVDTTRKKH